MKKKNSAGGQRSEDAFVKSFQSMRTAMNGGEPSPLPAEAKRFNQYMCNDGEHANKVAADLIRGMDAAFPAKK